MAFQKIHDALDSEKFYMVFVKEDTQQHHILYMNGHQASGDVRGAVFHYKHNRVAVSKNRNIRPLSHYEENTTTRHLKTFWMKQLIQTIQSNNLNFCLKENQFIASTK